MFGRRQREQDLADARADALRWYERLGGQIVNLPPGQDPATRQALVDAGERYDATGAQLERAQSPRQYALARETALEGLNYIRAARVAMGFDAGPPLPELDTQAGAGTIAQPRQVEVEGRQFRASPTAGGDTPYYYPGGRVQGRPVPAGWYSEPWWKTALATGAGVLGGMLLFDALSGVFTDSSYGYDQAYDQGYQAGHDQGYDQGYDQGSDAGNGGQDNSGNGDYATAADYQDYDAGGFDGGGYDGGGFDGGGFDSGF